MKDNIVYVKTENGIFKCYESETMHKPIYYPINSNGYIDYTDVIGVSSIDDLFIENQELKQDIKNLVHIINHNCLELETTKEEYESLKRWQNK